MEAAVQSGADTGVVALMIASLEGFGERRVIFTLRGALQSIHLIQLRALMRLAGKYGLEPCFDMEEVTEIDGAVIEFFALGEGLAARVLAPPRDLLVVLQKHLDQG